MVTVPWPLCDRGDATFNEDLLLDGLELSLIGMGVVFVVLSVLAISIKVFDRIDAMLPADAPAAVASGTARMPVSATSARADAAIAAVSEPDDAQTAAVIGVALALADAERGIASRSTSPLVRQPGAGSWVSTGRSREMTRRMTGMPRRGRTDS